MKKNSLIALIMLSSQLFSQNEALEALKAFPEAKSNEKQVYIQVPEMNNEENYKIEVFIGKNEMVDCNHYFMMGEVKEINLEGWGYTYYKVESNGQKGGTLMGCLDDKKVEKFITIEPKTFGYNSRLPLVFYVPNDFIVKYKIYSAGPLKEAETLKKQMRLGGIAYNELKNYFVKNNAKLPIPKNRITTQKQFDAIFGAGAYMGDGTPTNIDFNKEFVVPIILKETNLETEIIVKGVAMGSMGDVVVNYVVKRGKKMSFTIRPFHAIRINKENSGKIILKEEK
jgi:ecotin